MKFRFALLMASLVAMAVPAYASAAPRITSHFAIVSNGYPWLLYGEKELVGATSGGNPTSSPTYTEKVQMREEVIVHGFRMSQSPIVVNGAVFLALRDMGLVLSKMDVASSYSTRHGEIFLEARHGSCSLYWPMGEVALVNCRGNVQSVSVSFRNQPFLAANGTIQYPAAKVFQLLGFQVVALNGRLGIYSLPAGGISY